MFLHGFKWFWKVLEGFGMVWTGVGRVIIIIIIIIIITSCFQVFRVGGARAVGRRRPPAAIIGGVAAHC